MQGPALSGPRRAETDSEMLAELTLRYGPAVRRFLSRRLRDGADVEDLAQEVFVRLLKRAELSSIDNIEGYLFHTAANLLRERARRRARRHADQESAIEDAFVEDGDAFTPERILLGREAFGRMVAALEELPERPRTIFVLNRFEDLSAPQIARRLGVSVSTVEKDMMRAVAFLRERLA